MHGARPRVYMHMSMRIARRAGTMPLTLHATHEVTSSVSYLHGDLYHATPDVHVGKPLNKRLRLLLIEGIAKGTVALSAAGRLRQWPR